MNTKNGFEIIYDTFDFKNYYQYLGPMKMATCVYNVSLMLSCDIMLDLHVLRYYRHSLQ